MKKVVYSGLTIFLTLIVVLTGCGSKETSNQQPSGQQPSSSNNNQSASDTNTGNTGETIKLRVAGQYPIEHPNTEALMKFTERVNKETNGAIEFQVFPANQLGDYTLIYEEIMRGTVDLGLISIPTQFDARFDINWTGYLAETYAQAREVFAPDSFIFKTNESLNENLGVKFLGFHVEGFGGIGSVKELNEPANPTVDKGVLLRVPPIDIFRRDIEALGFRTVSIPYAELYTAMQTGVADGWAGGPPVANYHDVGDIIKHYYQYNNFFEIVPLLMNLELWNQLGEENQNIITAAASDLMMESMDIAEENDQYYRDEMEKIGIDIIEFTDEELKNLAEHTRKTTWPALKENLGEEIVEGLLSSYE